MNRLQFATLYTCTFMSHIVGVAGLVIGYISNANVKNKENISVYILIAVTIVSFFVFISFYTFLYDEHYKYIKKQIKMIRRARKSIIIVMHSLSNEDKNRLYKNFDEELEIAVKRLKNDSGEEEHQNKDNVRVLTYKGKEVEKGRVEGARQINEKQIPIRFLDCVEDYDCRFIVVDQRYIAFSVHKMHMLGLSKKYVYIESENLAKNLTRDFDEMWYNKNTKSYEECFGTTKDIEEIAL